MRNEKLGIERELPRINRELKEICPQADGVGEQQLFTHCQSKEEFIKLKQVSAIGQQLKEIGPQADDRSERECPQIYSHIANIKKSSSSSASFREFKKNIFAPWMICKPNEREGQLLINDERLMIIHTLSIKRGVHQATQVLDCPWLLCEPNEVEGRKLLAEIIHGGNFGQYDTRDAALKRGGYGETRGVETEASDETRQQLS